MQPTNKCEGHVWVIREIREMKPIWQGEPPHRYFTGSMSVSRRAYICDVCGELWRDLD